MTSVRSRGQHRWGPWGYSRSITIEGWGDLLSGFDRGLLVDLLEVVDAEIGKLDALIASDSDPDGSGASASRHWVLRSVARVCTMAGVPAVTPHGLRGTHATLAVGVGISGEAVAASLGHESFAVTAAHYAQPEAVSGAKAAKVADILG